MVRSMMSSKNPQEQHRRPSPLTPPPPPPPPHHPYSVLLPPASHLLNFFLLGLGFALVFITTTFSVHSSTFSFLAAPQRLLLSPPPPPPHPPPPPAPTALRPSSPPSSLDNHEGTAAHNMTDDELLGRASLAARTWTGAAGSHDGHVPKVAFLFLTRWELPFAPLWEMFFKGHEGMYSIYVHSDPAFNGSEPEAASVFYHRRIPSQEVKWGLISMVEAERRLLANALLDPANARFVLLSESHVPLFDFPTIYSYLLNSTKIYVESYDEPGHTGRGRYRKAMAPLVAVRQWRKGSQWFELDRNLAVEVVADATYFPVFRRHCGRRCYADEHYLPTFLGIRHRGALDNRSLTWVDWSRGGPHPARFTRMEVTVDFLRWLRGGSTCTYNGRPTTVCFLFARKFLPDSLTRFLRFAPKVMGFGGP